MTPTLSSVPSSYHFYIMCILSYTWSCQWLKLFDILCFFHIDCSPPAHEVQRDDSWMLRWREACSCEEQRRRVRQANRQPSRSQSNGRQAESVRWPAATRADSRDVKLSHQRMSAGLTGCSLRGAESHSLLTASPPAQCDVSAATEAGVHHGEMMIFCCGGETQLRADSRCTNSLNDLSWHD